MDGTLSKCYRLQRDLNAVSVFRRFSTQYFSIFQFFLRYCDIGYPPISPLSSNVKDISNIQITLFFILGYTSLLLSHRLSWWIEEGKGVVEAQRGYSYMWVIKVCAAGSSIGFLGLGLKLGIKFHLLHS